MQDKFVSTKFGRLHYRHGGTGAPLVLLHSNGGSAYDYEFVTERLMRRFEVFAWDMPGQGDSDPLPHALGVDAYADAVVEFMDAVGLAQAHVLGSSIGGAICVALGARHAHRVKRLFVVECPYRSPEEWLSSWWRTEVNFGQPVQSIAAVAPRLANVSPEFLIRWNVDRNKAGAKTMVGVMWALREYDFAGNLAKLPPDTVIVYGDKGPTIGNKPRLTGAITQPHALEVIAGSGHFPMVDDPDVFCTIVERYALA